MRRQTPGLPCRCLLCIVTVRTGKYHDGVISVLVDHDRRQPRLLTFHHPDVVERKAVFCEFSAGRLPPSSLPQLLNQNHISAQDRAGTGVIGPLAAAFCKIVISVTVSPLSGILSPIKKIIRMIASQRY